MIFAYIDDGTLEVFEGVVEARRQYSSETVEASVVRFFDHDGTPLGAVFPERTGRRILGMRTVGEPRVYELSPEAAAGAEPLSVVLDEVHVLIPNRWFASVEAVRSHIAR